MALGKYSPLEKEILVSVLTFIHSEALLKAGCYPRAGVGVPPFGVSGPHREKKSCLGAHTKYITTHNHPDKNLMRF